MKYSKKFETKVKRIANRYFRIIDTHKECTCCHKDYLNLIQKIIKNYIDGLNICVIVASQKGRKEVCSK